MSLMLNVMGDFFYRLGIQLLNPAIIFALLFAIIGGVLGLLSDKIVRVVKHIDHTEEKDKLLITLKVVSIVLLFVGILILVLRLI